MTIFKATFYTENDTEETVEIDMSDAVNSMELTLGGLWGLTAVSAMLNKPTMFAELVALELVCD